MNVPTMYEQAIIAKIKWLSDWYDQSFIQWLQHSGMSNDEIAVMVGYKLDEYWENYLITQDDDNGVA